MITKLYVRLFDDWSFENIYYSKDEADKSCKYDIQTIKTVEVVGEIVDDTVFIVVDDTWDVYGIFSSFNAAESLNVKNTVIKKINIK